MEITLTVVYIYLVVINIIGIGITCIDKWLAIHNKWRISERALVLCAILGAAFTMYVTMKIIHHKTTKPLFMIGFPVILFIHIAICMMVFYFI